MRLRACSSVIVVSSLIVAAPAPAQSSTAALEGTVHVAVPTMRGSAIVRVNAFAVNTDSTGHYSYPTLPPGEARVKVLSIGSAPFDTTIMLVAGTTTRLDVTLREPDYMAAERRRDVINAANGTVDSVADRLVRIDSTTGVTYDRFGLRLLNEIVKSRKPGVSTVVSPLSAGQALSIALLGAGGETEAAIARAIGTGTMTPDAVAAANRRFNDAAALRTDLILRVANALWIDTSRRFTPAFTKRASAAYPGAIRSVGLRTQPGIDAINHWADSATMGKIPRLLGKPFTDSTKAIVTNAVYLKAAWRVPFEKSATTKRPFHSGDGTTIDAPTMEMHFLAAYLRGDGYQVLRIPFRTGLTALYIVLPDTGSNARTLLAAMTTHQWPLPPAATQTDIHLRLPRLHVEDTIALVGPLARLGMGIAFDSLRADFRRMIVIDPRKENTIISRALQKVFFDLDEEGAVAAAVTGLMMSVVPTSAPPPPIEFDVNRPFLFLIRDERTQTALFAGYVAHP